MVPAADSFSRFSTIGRHYSRFAFTMLEVMVAIAIFSMVLAAIYSAWSAILRATKAGQIAAAEAQRTRVTMRALEESLGATRLFMDNARYYSFLADTSGDFAAVSFVSYLPPSFPGSGMFGQQALRRVMFSVEPGKRGSHELLLRQSPVLEPPDPTTEPYKIVLAPNVRQFRMFFYDTNIMDWVEEWLWTNRLPRMVRVQVAIAEPGNRPLQADEVEVKTIYLSSVAIPRELQVPAVRAGGTTRPPVSRPNPPAGAPPGATPPVRNPNVLVPGGAR